MGRLTTLTRELLKNRVGVEKVTEMSGEI